MPIYEYECSYCYRTFEAIGKHDGVPECPHCLMGHGIKKMSAASFRITGASARNGYSSIPKREEVLDAHGYAKKRWSR